MADQAGAKSEKRSVGWPFNLEAACLLFNLACCAGAIANGTYWLVPIPAGLAFACGIAQICDVINANKFGGA